MTVTIQTLTPFLTGLATGVGLIYLINGTSSTKTIPPSTSKKMMEKIESELTIPATKLDEICHHFVGEINKGLASDGQTLKCIPSYVTKFPTSHEKGSYLTLDLGGTNLRICWINLLGNGFSETKQVHYVVPSEVKVCDAKEVLIEFLVDRVVDALNEWGYDQQNMEKLKLGFTFSFPCNQTSINSGYSLHWTKGYSIPSLVHQDIVQLLQTSFHARSLPIKIVSLSNDTVGTLLSHSYTKATHIGVILGTGCNAAYRERIDEIPKLVNVESLTRERAEEMVVNVEWGAFDNERVVLPVTNWDRRLDEMSTHPGQQTFEKMISGLYLGELVRLILLDFAASSILFCGQPLDQLSTPNQLKTHHMSIIESDNVPNLNATKSILESVLGVHSTMEERELVRRVCHLVALRSARLAACGIAALVTKIGRMDTVVAIDGSLFEQYPYYESMICDALKEVLGVMSDGVKLEQAKDGSGLGAAIIAAICECQCCDDGR